MSFPGVALIIGAGSGYGKQTVLALAKNGCTKLTLADADAASLSQVEAECKALAQIQLDILTFKCDTTVPDDVDALVAAAVDRFGEINYCANCERPPVVTGSTTAISLDQFKMTWQRGVWLALRAQVRQFLAQQAKGSPGAQSIVNVTAAQGTASEPSLPGLCGSAHGIVGMTRATAQDYCKNGIRINAVCAGPGALVLGSAPTGKPVTPDEVAQAVVFLLGPAASGITGIELPVDGGWSLYHH